MSQPPEQGTEFLERRCAALEARLRRVQDEQREREKALLLGLLDVDDALVRMGEWLGRVGEAGSGMSERELLLGLIEQVAFVDELLRARLGTVDVRPLRLLGSAADAEVADVVEVLPTGEVPAGTVVAERRGGFLLGGEILRRAELVVAVDPVGGQEPPSAPR
ncbi:nucleotide exchange factor GrpE [Kitasatospora sp. NPDC048365]|uniref:nucleotide exchange factor GrpE n=1 Tax=Kitasatospora sp. NPDC048365 TaxID=3364050 RepID=UPI00371A93CC